MISPETVAELCIVLGIEGEEALEWLAASVIENPKNTGRAEVFRRVFLAQRALGVAMLLWLASVGAPSGAGGQTTAQNAGTDLTYRMANTGLYISAVS